MYILIVAATVGELGPLCTELGIVPQPASGGAYSLYHSPLKPHISVLIAGVGMLATCFALTQVLAQHPYQWVVQAGVAGSFDNTIALGSVLRVTTEQIADFGAEDQGNFIDVFDLGLQGANEAPYIQKCLLQPSHAYDSYCADLPTATGLTSNLVSGHVPTIAHRRQLYGAQIESMEGAPFFFVCLQMGVAFTQIRAISNYVLPRDKSQWQMKTAIEQLNNRLIHLIAQVATTTP